MSRFRCGGFTLTEVLVVVLILNILAAVVVPKVSNAVTRSRYTATATICRLSRSLQENGASAADLQRRLDCLLDAVAEVDPPFLSEAEAAWRIALSPAFTFMQLPQSQSAA